MALSQQLEFADALPRSTVDRPLRFIDLFAGLGGFHVGLSVLGHECVFACELDETLRQCYEANFPKLKGRVYGDIRECQSQVPPHDILCAGFPCQPFSKSGSQLGLDDPTRGTLFHEIVQILEQHQPTYVFLENVGNFERHDGGRTWEIVQEELNRLGYYVKGTTHVTSGGTGLLSPHHLGFPHHRERFFMVAQKAPFERSPFPKGNRKASTEIDPLIDDNELLTGSEIEETKLTQSQIQCIEHWNEFLRVVPDRVRLPSFPIWSDEADAVYPYDGTTPHSCSLEQLKPVHRFYKLPASASREEVLAKLPSYARRPGETFPKWKIAFIRQNRAWFKEVIGSVDPKWWQGWLRKLRKMPASFRKLEWNCKGETRNLWCHILQLRPSGVRVKRYQNSPALVAMTSTQIPIMGPRKRFLTRREGLRLQQLPVDHLLPQSRVASFKALGNGIHAGVVKAIAQQWLPVSQTEQPPQAHHLLLCGR